MSKSDATVGARRKDAAQNPARFACTAFFHAASHKGFSPGAISLGQAYLRALFGGRSTPRIGDEGLLQLVRVKFAEACLRCNVTGLSGQSEPWYAKAEQMARARRQVRRTRPTASPRRRPGKAPSGKTAATQAAAAQATPAQAPAAAAAGAGTGPRPGSWRDASTCVPAKASTAA